MFSTVRGDILMRSLLLTVTLLTLFGVQVEAVQCYDCVHIEVTTSSSTVNSLLDAITVSDPNCLESGISYIPDDTVSCLGTCFKQTGSLTVTFGIFLGSATLEVATRGCSPISVVPDQCVKSPIESYWDTFFFTIESSDVEVCYCNDGLCNHGNVPERCLFGMFLSLILVLVLV